MTTKGNSDYRYQDGSNKTGEVTYRKKVADQERDHPEEWMGMMRTRIADTVRVFEQLAAKYGITFSPETVMGEFGAERAQRVLGLINHYGLKKSFAFDISPDMLALSKTISEHCFTRGKDGTLPHERLVIVADDFLKAPENIAPDKLDMVFCFATIHHFPDPRPVFQTAYSLLKDGGYMYFDREAMKSWLGLHELGRIDTYLKHGHIIERDYGILETQFSLERWREAISLFEDWDVRLKYPVPGVEKIYNFSLRSILSNKPLRTVARLFGGRIYGILRKKGRINR